MPGTALVLAPTFGSFTWLPGAAEGFVGADPDQALSLYRGRIRQAEAAGDVLASRYLRYMAAQAHEEFGCYRECLDLAQQLADEADPVRDPLWRAATLALTVQATLHFGWNGPVLEVLAEALDLIERHPHLHRDRGLAAMGIAMAVQAAGAYGEADAMLRDLLRQDPQAEIHLVPELVLLHLTSGAESRLGGEHDAAARYFSTAVSLALRWRRLATAYGDAEHVGRSLVCEAYALEGLGLPEAAMAVEREVRGTDLLHGRLEHCLLELHGGHISARQGEPQRARACFTRAFDAATRNDAGVWQATALVALAEAEELAHGSHPAVGPWRQLARALLRRLGDQSRSFASELEVRRRAARLSAQTDRMSSEVLQDGLTGLANRRALDHALEAAAVTGEPVGACFVDVDHFKAVNDTFSHAVGDAVLIVVAQLTVAACRSTDVIARYGGDEFVVLTRGDVDSAGPLAERIRSAVRAHPWTSLAPGLQVTVSVGLAASLPAAAVLAAADAALLQAKRSGRDRVAVEA